MDTFSPPMSPEAVNRLSGLELAYLGDTVCDLYVRQRLVSQGIGVHDMHRHAVSLVNAKAQANALARIQSLLSEEEAAWVRRGQNAKAHHAAPHGVDHRVYSQSSAFEALLGGLYLTGRRDRLRQLLSIAMEENQ